MDCVVVYKVDRLSRSLMDFARIIEVFDQKRRQLRVGHPAVQHDQFPRTADAEHPPVLRAVRTRDHLRAHARQACRRRGGRANGSAGIRSLDTTSIRKGGRIVVNPEEAEQVRTIFDLYLEHQAPCCRSCEETERRGLRDQTLDNGRKAAAGGKRIHQETAARHADQRHLHRHGRPQGQLYAGEHERIIDQETWDRVQKLLRRNGADNGRQRQEQVRRAAARAALLRPCGAPMMHTYTMREVETLPLLRLLQRPAAGLEELRDEVGWRTGDRDGGHR